MNNLLTQGRVACIIIIIIIIKHPEYGSYRRPKKKKHRVTPHEGGLWRIGRNEQNHVRLLQQTAEDQKDSGWEASNTWQEKAGWFID